MFKKWINARIEERTTLDGVVLVVAGLSYLVLGQAIASVIAYGAIIYGAWTIYKSE
jgi:hypothetical protein